MGSKPLLPRAAAEAGAYDTLYTDDAVAARADKMYYRLSRRVADIAAAKGVRSVLEVGCGNGAQAQMLIAEGIDYRGFDFNAHAVERAKRRNGSSKHFIGDATDPAAYALPYDAIVCCEVLEHINDDLEAIELWRPGALCICSVPNFDYDTHVRFFRHEDEVRARYGHLIDIDWIKRNPVSPIAGIPLGEYLTRLRWARDNPKKFLGMLGVNRFEWLAGWFIFVGTRR